MLNPQILCIIQSLGSCSEMSEVLQGKTLLPGFYRRKPPAIYARYRLNPKTKQIKMQSHIFTKELKLDFLKNCISSLLYSIELISGEARGGTTLPAIPSIWLHYTLLLQRGPQTFFYKLLTMSDYSLLFPQREYKISYVRYVKIKVILVSGSTHCSV